MQHEPYPTSSTSIDRHVVVERDAWAPIPEALLYDPSITANAVRIYGCLARHGTDPANCYPSHERIAKLLGMSARSVARPLAELAEAGWVTKVKRPPLADGTRRPDSYYVHLSRSPARSTAQSSAEPARDPARDLRAESRDEREPVEREPVGNDTRAPALELLVAETEQGDAFDEFWSAYPRGDGKPAARKAWERAVRVAHPSRIMEGLDGWLAYWSARNQPEFVPWAQKWLNQQQWFADPPTIRGSGSPLGPGSARVNEAWEGVGSGRIRL